MVSPKEHGLLGEEGIELQGSELSLDEAVALARKRYKWMPLCAVEEWTILDAIVTDEERAKVTAAGCQPIFMFAHKVVDDEQRRFEPGHSGPRRSKLHRSTVPEAEDEEGRRR